MRLATRILLSSKSFSIAEKRFARETPDLSPSLRAIILSEARRGIAAATKLRGLPAGQVLQARDIPLAAKVAGHAGTQLRYQYRVEIFDSRSPVHLQNRVVYVDSSQALEQSRILSAAQLLAANEKQYVPGRGWVEVSVSARATFTISSVVRSR